MLRYDLVLLLKKEAGVLANTFRAEVRICGCELPVYVKVQK